MSTTRRKVHLILDFDSTLTAADTLSTVASIGYHFHAQQHPSVAAPPPPFSDISAAYLADLNAHTASYTPPAASRTHSAAESAWLASLAPVEQRSFERMRGTGVFFGIGEERMFDAGAASSVALRRGWADALAAWADTEDAISGAEGAAVGVVSVNWSAAFIRGVLGGAAAAAADSAEGKALERLMARMPVLANEIADEGEEDGSDTGIALYTSADKLENMRLLTGDWAPRELVDAATVYVGDSVTDFDCLLQADFGVCVREDARSVESLPSGQRELAGTLSRVGVTVAPLGALLNLLASAAPGTSYAAPAGEQNKTLWWTDDLADVGKLVTLLRSR